MQVNALLNAISPLLQRKQKLYIYFDICNMKCPVESIAKTWLDDERMDVLYSKFRERALNSVHYDCKMKFWVNAILDMMKERHELQIKPATIMERMRRKGKVPHCIDTVIEEMVKTKKLTPKNEFMDMSNALFKGALKLLLFPVSWISQYVVGSSVQNPNSEFFVAEELVDETVAQILSHLHGRRTSPYALVITKENFVNSCVECGCHVEDIDLIITKLLKDDKAIVLSLEDPKIQVLKLVAPESKYVTPITEIEKSMVLLKDLESRLNSDLQHLDEEINTNIVEIKKLLAAGQRNIALRLLRKKKNFEKFRTKKESSLFNIQSIISNLEETDTSKEVLDAFTMGSSALKNLMKTESLTLEKAEDVLLDVNESVSEQAEISNMLSNMSIAGEDESEIEKELEEMIKKEAEADAGSIISKLPKAPSSEPAETAYPSIPSSATIIDKELEEVNKSLSDMTL